MFYLPWQISLLWSLSSRLFLWLWQPHPLNGDSSLDHVNLAVSTQCASPKHLINNSLPFPRSRSERRVKRTCSNRENSVARSRSAAPFLCLILDHRLWPERHIIVDVTPRVGNVGIVVHDGRKRDGPSRDGPATDCKRSRVLRYIDIEVVKLISTLELSENSGLLDVLVEPILEARLI